MLFYPNTTFSAQSFLGDLSLEFLICKSCPRAKIEKEYGKIRGFCGGFDNPKPLYPTDYLCPFHDLYSKIENAAYDLEDVIYEIEKGGDNHVQSL